MAIDRLYNSGPLDRGFSVLDEVKRMFGNDQSDQVSAFPVTQYRGAVIIELGKEGEMTFIYERWKNRPVQMRTVVVERSVPDNVLAATRYWLNCEIDLKTNGRTFEQQETINGRISRIKVHLKSLGRDDIIKQGEDFRNLPGIGRK